MEDVVAVAEGRPRAPESRQAAADGFLHYL
jgi:hypothetical protein